MTARAEGIVGLLNVLNARRQEMSDASIALTAAAMISGDAAEAVTLIAESLMCADDAAVRARLVRLAGGVAAAEAAIHSAPVRLARSRAISFDGVSPGPARSAFVAIFTNGATRPEVRAASSPDARLERVLDYVRRASFPVSFPDRVPARILTDGELECFDTGRSCVVMLRFGSPQPAP